MIIPNRSLEKCIAKFSNDRFGLNSAELAYLEHDYSLDHEKELWNLFCKTIVECLPNEYQQLVQMKVSNPTRPTKEELISKNHGAEKQYTISAHKSKLVRRWSLTTKRVN